MLWLRQQKDVITWAFPSFMIGGQSCRYILWYVHTPDAWQQHNERSMQLLLETSIRKDFTYLAPRSLMSSSSISRLPKSGTMLRHILFITRVKLETKGTLFRQKTSLRMAQPSKKGDPICGVCPCRNETCVFLVILLARLVSF